MAIYLLPCSCGRKLRVEPRQAGEVIACGCGASLTVPTMREMADLEQAEPKSDTREKWKPWGVHQRLILLGVVLVLLSGPPAIYLWGTLPIIPKRDFDPVAIRRQVDSLSPVHSWHLFRNLRQQGPTLEPLPQTAVQAEKLLRHRIYAGVLTLFACAGIGLIVVALTRRRRTKA
ncbi:MAG TPA: hypothetical protein VE890_09900 [Thermoguttaceae bacterium]|nr:hypothetical protein [Thermoguttaceae bacterium]